LGLGFKGASGKEITSSRKLWGKGGESMGGGGKGRCYQEL